MSDEYQKHLEKRIKEIRERTVKSNLHRSRKKESWKIKFFIRRWKSWKRKVSCSGLEKTDREDEKITPRHKTRVDKDKKK